MGEGMLDGPAFAVEATHNRKATAGQHNWQRDLDFIVLLTDARGQRRKPFAEDVEFVSERIGWLPFVALLG